MSPGQPVRVRVGLADAPSGPRNRLVVYDWFVRGEGRAPPRAGNLVELLIDGEQAWARVAGELEAAQRHIAIAMWMIRPDIELVRPLALATRGPRARARLRLGAVLERRASVGVTVRLLIWGLVYSPIVDRWLRRWTWRPHPPIEVLEQDHPSPIGSLHQKCVILDGRVGYCGGMNLRENDWDTPAHAIYDPRRNPSRSGALRRRLVAARWLRPIHGPRHDVGVRVEGPVVADLVADFHARWAASVAARRHSWVGRIVDRLRRALGRPPAAPLPEPVRPPSRCSERCGEHWAQVVRTSPTGAAEVLDAYVRAIRNARRYIYIENQYFRSPRIGEELRDAVRRNPSLRLAVVVRPVNDGRASWFDPSGYWTAQTLDRVREARPEFALTRLIARDRCARGRPVFEDIDVHAKLMVIDDLWLTIGSVNLHDRGLRSEGELNLVVVDGRLGRELRIRLMAEHLELPVDDPRLADIDAAFALWDRHAADNPERLRRGLAPRSRVHRFVQRGARRPPFGVGSGVF